MSSNVWGQREKIEDRVSPGWADFVYEAYADIVKSGAF